MGSFSFHVPVLKSKRMLWCEDVLSLIEIQKLNNPIIAIDGRCASGKSTLAKYLSEKLSMSIVHMDDFYLQKFQRTKERYAEPGGNLDRERFMKEVLEPLNKGLLRSYTPFDCAKMELSDSVIPIAADHGLIIEGSYSLRPEFRTYYDYKVFLYVNQEAQWKRIQIRNPDKADRFQSEWIPYEEKYFQAFDVQSCADLVYDTSFAF